VTAATGTSSRAETAAGTSRSPDATRTSGHADTQQQAIHRAREIVTNLGDGEVRIHGRNGQIRDADTVGGGNDPHPPIDRK